MATKLMGPSNPIQQSASISSIGGSTPQTITGNRPISNAVHNTPRSGLKNIDLLTRINSTTKQKRITKVAGIFKALIGKGIKYNLEKNKLGLGLAAATGYATGGVGNAVTSTLESGFHVIPGVDVKTLSKIMKEKRITDDKVKRGLIRDDLEKIKKQ